MHTGLGSWLSRTLTRRGVLSLLPTGPLSCRVRRLIVHRCQTRSLTTKVPARLLCSSWVPTPFCILPPPLFGLDGGVCLGPPGLGHIAFMCPSPLHSSHLTPFGSGFGGLGHTLMGCPMPRHRWQSSGRPALPPPLPLPNASKLLSFVGSPGFCSPCQAGAIG